MRSALALLAMVAALLGVAVSDASAASRNGVLSMTPARRTLVAKPPQHLTPTRISNSTQLPMDVTVFPVLLTQQLDGSFDFSENARDLNAARLMFPVKPQRFVLQPDQEKFLDLRWQLLPRTARAGYFGLVVQGVPKAKGKGVGSVLRLLGINFFTLPGHWKVDGRITGLRGQQAAPRVLRFLPKVRNTGQIHAAPQKSVCVITGNGQRLRLPYGNGVVLPGYEREYPVLVQKPHVLPAGPYSMKCSQIFGHRKSSSVLAFKLSGPNTLPTASLKLQSITASGEISGKATVHAKVRNVGSKASNAVLKVRIDRIPVGSRPVLVARGRFPQGSIGAGSTKNASVSLGKLVPGNYRATVVLSDGRSDLDARTADFAATKHRGFFDRLKDHWWWLLILLAVLLILWLLWRQRRKQRELEEELERARHGYIPEPVPTRRERAREDEAAAAATAAGAQAEPPARLREDAPPPPRQSAPPPAPAPTPPAREDAPAAAPAPGGRINVNSASVEELMQLPGVGRRAAERIVAHREANGPFTSLEDLHAVEGWHAERIRRIADSASV